MRNCTVYCSTTVRLWQTAFCSLLFTIGAILKNFLTPVATVCTLSIVSVLYYVLSCAVNIQIN